MAVIAARRAGLPALTRLAMRPPLIRISTDAGPGVHEDLGNERIKSQGFSLEACQDMKVAVVSQGMRLAWSKRWETIA